MRPVAVYLCFQFALAVVLKTLCRGIGPGAAHKPSGCVVVITESRPVGIDEARQASRFIVPEPEGVAFTVGGGDAGLAATAVTGVAVGC